MLTLTTMQLEIHHEGDIPDLMGSPDPFFRGGLDGKTVCLALEKFVNYGGALKMLLRLSFALYCKMLFG